jgi:hypothetical protein
MKGSIRIFAGFLMALGATGGMDAQPDFLIEQLLVAVAGLGLMVWGVVAMKKQGIV